MKFKRGDYVKASNGAEGEVTFVDKGTGRVAVRITEGTPSMRAGSEQVFREGELRK